MDQFQNNLNNAQIKMRDNEFCDVTLASVDDQPFKFVVNKKNHRTLIFMRGIENESHLLNPFTLKKNSLKKVK